MPKDTTDHEKVFEGIVRIPAIVTLGLIGLSGCVSLPALEPASSEITQRELSGHVEFLSQYALQGRSPRSRGSAAARRYISRQFGACGLVPWGQAKGFEQPFTLGTNVIGVLPGSDPNLSQEFVILAAHYDHKGWTRKGLCRGACDNASGVAALLEIAEQLASCPPRPRRSVCFAAFDCEEEMLLGAMAFTCRADYDPTRIAAVVNLDMLGRDGFEVLNRHLFVMGTENYPDLRSQIQGLARDRIGVLPIGTDIAGPRGDHVAFEPLGVPAIFFTCSLYRDYHRPGDTADKLDYEDLLHSTQVACETVKILVDSPGRFEPTPQANGDLEELKALHLCLSRVAQDPNRLGLTDEERQAVGTLVKEIDRLLGQPTYSLDDRRRLLWWHVGEVLPPLMARFEDSPLFQAGKSTGQKEAQSRRAIGLASMEARDSMVEAGRAFIRHLQNRRHLLMAGAPPFEYSRTTLPDSFFSLDRFDNGSCALHACMLSVEVKHRQPPVWMWPLRGMDTPISIQINGLDWVGTQQELSDVCLLTWTSEKDPNCSTPAWLTLLARLTGEHHPKTLQQWLDRRLSQGPWPDEHRFVLDRVRSNNYEVVYAALNRAWRGPRPHEAAILCRQAVSDPNTDPFVKVTLIESMDRRAGGQGLSALADTLGDSSPLPRIVLYYKDPSYRELIRYLIASDKAGEKKGKDKKPTTSTKKPPATIGDLAYNKLKALTKKDLGKDKQAWIRWIERHYPTDAPG